MTDRIMDFLKAHPREAALSFVIVVTATLSFGLGYLADHAFDHAVIAIEPCSQP